MADAPPLEKTFQDAGGPDMTDCFHQAEEELLREIYLSTFKYRGQKVPILGAFVK